MNIKVNLWGKLLGALYFDEKTKRSYFSYSNEFVDLGLETSPIFMPLKKKIIYSFSNLPEATFYGLPGMLADALPDRFGNKLIQQWLAMQGKDIKNFNPAERLAYMGNRSMGALEFEPSTGPSKTANEKLNLESLARLATQIVDQKSALNVNLKDDAALANLFQIGTSAGGARAKVLAAINFETGDIVSGQLNTPKGFTSCLLKFDGAQDMNDPRSEFQYGVKEYIYYKMAQEAKINMTHSGLINGQHFYTVRFDRTAEGEKLHMQTLCGLAHMDYNNPTAYSYEQAFAVLRELKLPYKDSEQLYRRLLFNVIARNQDDHTKNISFLMNQKGEWSLSPAYDINYSYNPAGIFTSQHQMSIHGKNDNFEYKDLIKIGNDNSINKPEEIFREVNGAVSLFEELAKKNNLDKIFIKEIISNHRLQLRPPKLSNGTKR